MKSNIIQTKQSIEIEYWRNSKTENPESDSINNIINKFSEASIFLDCLNCYKSKLVDEGRVLELGAGQGWASCIYKKLYPKTHITVTDISKYAIMSVNKWEKMLEVKIDNAYACKSSEINEDDNSIN